MSNLFVFGDSYSEVYNDRYHAYPKYKEFKNGIYPETWSELLSKSFNLNLINHAKGGIGNDQIFQNVCKHSNEFKKNDIIIIGWTYMHRFRWTNSDIPNDWLCFSSHHGKFEKDYISESTCNDVVLSRQHKLYQEQLHDFENIVISLSNSVGFRLYFWNNDFDNDFYYNSVNKKFLKKYLCIRYLNDKNKTIFDEIFKRNGQTIYNETNGLVSDIHLAESGHKIQFELFYEHLTENIII